MESFASPPEGLFRHRSWQLSRDGVAREAIDVAEWRVHGNGYVVRLAGAESPESATRFVGMTIAVERSQLAPTREREYYLADLVGLVVENAEGVEMGRIEHFIDAPANAVMVIKGEREHLVPVTKQHLLRVDTEQGRVFVDWPADF